ncbi:hypothetical protein ACFLZM_00975 [Thermodesulfobacteriota bacterium]
MKNLKKDLQDVNKALGRLSKKVEKMIAAAGKSGKPVTKAKPAKKAVQKKEKTMTASEIVLGIIKRSRKGVAIGTLKEKSGFEGQKLNNVLYVLKKQGKINNPSKGVYVKA